MPKIDFIVYVVTDRNGNIMDSGVANDMSDIVQVCVPDHDFYFEAAICHLEDFCYRGKFDLNITILGRSIDINNIF